MPAMLCLATLMTCFHDHWSRRQWSSYYATINASEASVPSVGVAVAPHSFRHPSQGQRTSFLATLIPKVHELFFVSYPFVYLSLPLTPTLLSVFDIFFRGHGR